MLTDPVALTIGGAAKSLPRSGTDSDSSEYRLVEGSTIHTLTIEHDYRARNRCTIALRKDGLVSDPLLTGQSKAASQTVRVVMDWDPLIAASDPRDLFLAIAGYFTSANLLRVIGGET